MVARCTINTAAKPIPMDLTTEPTLEFFVFVGLRDCAKGRAFCSGFGSIFGVCGACCGGRSRCGLLHGWILCKGSQCQRDPDELRTHLVIDPQDRGDCPGCSFFLHHLGDDCAVVFYCAELSVVHSDRFPAKSIPKIGLGWLNNHRVTNERVELVEVEGR